MKILLIYPVPPRAHWPLGEFRSTWVPTGLACIATSLKRTSHQVAVHVREETLVKNGFDWSAADAQLAALLREFRPDMVGLSVTTPTMPEAAAIATLAKEALGRHVLVVAGGVHPTAVPEAALREAADVDVAALGEGERTLVELAEKGPAPSVRGIVFRQGESLVRTEPRPSAEDLDTLGPPAYDLFDMKYYTQPSRWLIRWLELSATNVRTSRGCSHRCSFCAGHVVAGLGVRYHSIPYVLDQLRHAADHLHVEAVHFEDDTLGADRERLMALCDAICRQGLHRRLTWDGCLRVNQADAELLAAMRAAGCIQVEYGFESGSDDSLRRLGKGATAELNMRAVRLTREAGLRIFADIMVGLPGETPADLRQTVSFLRRARPEVISAARLCPLPGTQLYKNLPQATRDAMDLGGYAYLDYPATRVNLTAMPDATFERLYRRFQNRLVRPQILWALLRDTAKGNRDVRRRLRRRLAGFIMRHPIRALRAPW